jgi:signal peptidase II
MNKLISKINFKNIAIIIMIAIFFLIDRCLKSLALNQGLKPTTRLIGDIFSFNFTPNYYIAFSLPVGGKWLNLLVILIIIALIIYIFYLTLKGSKQRINIILLTIILFGAISNILDRLIFGYVIDYFELHYFTIFNLADVMISGGAVLFLFNSFKPQNRERTSKKNFSG